MDLAGSSREELANINNNELGRIADLVLSPLPPPPPCDGCVYRLHALPFTSLSHLNGQHTHVLLLCTNPNIHIAGDTNCDHHIVTGVLSFIIILISGVAAFVIILLLLKIRRQNLILQ